MPTYLVTYRNGKKQRFSADNQADATKFARQHAKEMSKFGQPSDDWRLGDVRKMKQPFPKED